MSEKSTKKMGKRTDELYIKEAFPIIGNIGETTLRRYIEKGAIPAAVRKGGLVIKKTVAMKIQLARSIDRANFLKKLSFDTYERFLVDGPVKTWGEDVARNSSHQAVPENTICSVAPNRRQKLESLAKQLVDLNARDLAAAVALRALEAAS
ncbi:MAG: hypothetical protein J7501_03970 [Bdellovibrio sp.]|nr:hypothetical protein [Bdellovibrio sp.]